MIMRKNGGNLEFEKAYPNLKEINRELGQLKFI